ncbi:disulfide bond formation protein DsbB [Zophobihabitans entericus]|uniref:Disulfide bond formation protein B n=1 Tax=Zophobihabitans entericus TaxID=1635327 RepID=A0A6G9IC96_9GAMM|nr:disulfide bond formation protein DsbB [Zophobihabitans entericus]QIQ21856.1 disulfide bond formation protein DsbB [Zophobihabitans entericus]
MLRLLSQYSRGRTAWFLLFLSAVSFEIVALYFQHVLALAPCVLCIYQRCVILGIMISSLIAMIKPKSFFLRFVAIIIWLFSAVQGFLLAYDQVVLQFRPSIFNSCPVDVQFPSWLPLDSWFPAMFKPYGVCSERVWDFLTIEMSQWLLIIFSCYFIVGLLVLISQLFKPRNRAMWNE